MLYEEVVEVSERVQLVFDNDRKASDIKGISSDYVRVLEPPNLVELRAQLSVYTIPRSSFKFDSI